MKSPGPTPGKRQRDAGINGSAGRNRVYNGSGFEMLGDVYISIMDIEKWVMGPEPKIPYEKVELMTQRRDFYGLVAQVGNFVMISPEIEFRQTDILLSGNVLQGPNFTIYQEWRFCPYCNEAPPPV